MSFLCCCFLLYLDVVITCPATVIPHGVVTPSGPVPVNQTATVHCDDGYKLTGLPTVKCVMDAGATSATWNGAISTCESECTCECMLVHLCIGMHANVDVVQVSVFLSGCTHVSLMNQTVTQLQAEGPVWSHELVFRGAEW